MCARLYIFFAVGSLECAVLLPYAQVLDLELAPKMQEEFDYPWLKRMYHTYITLLVPAVLAFIITVIATRFIIDYMLESGITGMDHNKGKRAITLPSSGGIATAVGFTIGVLAYAFGGSFHLYVPVASLRYLFATVIAVLLVTIVGFLDDLNVSRKMVRTTDMMDTHKGLKQWQKPLLTLMGALPLMACKH